MMLSAGNALLLGYKGCLAEALWVGLCVKMFLKGSESPDSS